MERKRRTVKMSIYSGMSKQELKLTLQMCGKGEDDIKKELPDRFMEVSAKGTQDSFKKLIIHQNIKNNAIYNDSEIPLIAQLVKMISKRSWCGKESNTRRSSIIKATEGLVSPFIVSDLDKDEVAKLKYDTDAITATSDTTVEDILKLCSKAKAKVLETAKKFMLLLRTHADLLFALFCRLIYTMWKYQLNSYRPN